MPVSESVPSGALEEIGGHSWTLVSLGAWVAFFFAFVLPYRLPALVSVLTMPPVMGEEQITTTYLEMSNPADLRPKRVSLAGLEIRQVEIVSPEFNWFLHQAVGAVFRWGGREDWGRAEWAAYVGRPELETWVAYVKGAPAGYFELEQHEVFKTEKGPANRPRESALFAPPKFI